MLTNLFINVNDWQHFMETQYINITNEDLEHYFKTLSNKGLIRQARIRMFSSMPSDIKAEFKTKVNELACIDQNKGLHKIVAENASDKLQRYLDQLVFRLTDVESSKSGEKKDFNIMPLNIEFKI